MKKKCTTDLSLKGQREGGERLPALKRGAVPRAEDRVRGGQRRRGRRRVERRQLRADHRGRGREHVRREAAVGAELRHIDRHLADRGRHDVRLVVLGPLDADARALEADAVEAGHRIRQRDRFKLDECEALLHVQVDVEDGVARARRDGDRGEGGVEERAQLVLRAPPLGELANVQPTRVARLLRRQRRRARRAAAREHPHHGLQLNKRRRVAHHGVVLQLRKEQRIKARGEHGSCSSRAAERARRRRGTGRTLRRVAVRIGGR